MCIDHTRDPSASPDTSATAVARTVHADDADKSIVFSLRSHIRAIRSPRAASRASAFYVRVSLSASLTTSPSGVALPQLKTALRTALSHWYSCDAVPGAGPDALWSITL